MKFISKGMRLLLVLHCLAPCAGAQSAPPKFEIGINLGTLVYQGDLSPSLIGSFKTPGFAVGINGIMRLNPVLSLRADLTLGRLRGDDSRYRVPAWRQQRNFNFTTPVTEITAMVEWKPLSNARLSPYFFAGAGLSFLKISRDYSRFNAEYFINENIAEGLAADAAHNLPRMIPVVPAGLGLRYPLTPVLSLHTEAAYRLVFTDYLDGFSRAANPERLDHYYKLSVGLRYALSGRSNYDCPVVKY